MSVPPYRSSLLLTLPQRRVELEVVWQRTGPDGSREDKRVGRSFSTVRCWFTAVFAAKLLFGRWVRHFPGVRQIGTHSRLRQCILGIQNVRILTRSTKKTSRQTTEEDVVSNNAKQMPAVVY
jgi:hypothetical protein